MQVPQGNELQKAIREADSRFAAYERAKAGAGVLKKIGILRAIAEKGLAAVLGRRASDASRDEVTELVDLFEQIGSSAVLLTGSQRGGDFLNNQLRGQWAERVCCSMTLPRHVLRRFGPSGAAMPGDDDHARVVRAYGEITLIEGKRPDLIAFDRGWWDAAPPSDKARVDSWPERLLGELDEELMAHARAGVEVKASVWHYTKRRAAGGGLLAITVKDEEIDVFAEWSRKTGLPVLFLQVLFDEVYCMSFRRMLRAKKVGWVYREGDYVAEKDRKTGKFYHRFFVGGPPHLCAKTAFPDKSEARVPVLPDGYVIPHVRLAPAEAHEVRADVIEAELGYEG